MLGYRVGTTLAVPGGVVMGFNEPFSFTIATVPDWTSEDGTCWLRGEVDDAEGFWTLRVPHGLPLARPGVLYGTPTARHDYTATNIVRSYVMGVQLPSRYARTRWPEML